MLIPQEFDAIRPYEAEELPEVFDRLLNNPQIKRLVASTFPNIPFEIFAQRVRACKTTLQFQKTVFYQFIKDFAAKVSTGMEMDSTAIDKTKCYTFVSNHRDIVLDSAFLCVLLLDAGFATTCEIAIGDNLLVEPWIKDLVRVNKSFIVERGLPLRETLTASKRLSEYIHFAMNKKHESLWIAQREGRAKDSNDRTQEAILKMMAMGGEGSITERLTQLHIVPLTISYEYDPCDYLKAREFQLKRDNPEWKKSPQDDLLSMQTGILGYKGHIHYHCSPCINGYLKSLDTGMPKAELYNAIALFIDKNIHSNYRLYPCNYIALDRLQRTSAHGDKYNAKDESFFNNYIEGQLAKISIPNKDEEYLKERILTMYAYPAINYFATQ